MRSPSIVAISISILLSLAACGGAQARPEPPSGAVDPGVHGLATAGGAPAIDASPSAPSAGGARAGARALITPPASAPVIAGRGAEDPGEVSGEILMTREHCEALGRKFADLAREQGAMMGALGGDAALDREAEGVGRSFADRCGKDMAGQRVPAREYQCMLRARAANDLLGCKR